MSKITPIDLMVEAKCERDGIDLNPGICTQCHEEKIVRDKRNICATCVYRFFLKNELPGDRKWPT